MKQLRKEMMLELFDVITAQEAAEFKNLDGFEENSQIITNPSIQEMHQDAVYLVKARWLKEADSILQCKSLQ